MIAPVNCNDPESLRMQAAKMRRAALDYAICESNGQLCGDDVRVFSGMSPEEWAEFKTKLKNKEFSPEDFKCNAAIQIQDKIISVSLTFEKFDAFHQWHVSMVHVIPSGGLAEIPDAVARKLAMIFLNSEEIKPLENRGNLPQVRHFTAIAK